MQQAVAGESPNARMCARQMSHEVAIIRASTVNSAWLLKLVCFQVPTSTRLQNYQAWTVVNTACNTEGAH